MTWWDYPSPVRLDQHPELGALAVLEAAVYVAINAVLAEHPETWLEDENGPQDDRVPPEVRRLLCHAHRLRKSLVRYHAMLDGRDAQERGAAYDPNDVPF
jgi:hypothetical protein